MSNKNMNELVSHYKEVLADENFQFIYQYLTNYSIGNFFIDNVMTIGIETLEEYRRQGLSQISTEAFIEECFKSDNHVQLECMGENIASIKFAEKLRFKKISEYTLYSFPFSKLQRRYL